MEGSRLGSRHLDEYPSPRDSSKWINSSGMIVKYCVTGVRFYNASMTNSSGILNAANRDSRSVTAICDSHPVALSTRCLWCGRAFAPRATGGSAQKFCSTGHRQEFWIAARRWNPGFEGRSHSVHPEKLRGSLLSPCLERCWVDPERRTRRFEGRFSDAIAIFVTALDELPGHAGIYRYLASCYAHAGRLDNAREIIKRLRTITPNILPNVVQWRSPEHREFFLSGLRLAMSEAE